MVHLYEHMYIVDTALHASQLTRAKYARIVTSVYCSKAIRVFKVLSERNTKMVHYSFNIKIKVLVRCKDYYRYLYLLKYICLYIYIIHSNTLYTIDAIHSIAVGVIIFHAA